MEPIFYIVLDSDYIVRTVVQSNLVPDHAIEVDAETYEVARSKTGLCRYVDGALVDYEPPPGPPPALPDISDRQFGRGLWGEKVITFDECEQFVSVGAIPAALQAIIDQLPDDDTGAPTPRKEAVILVKGAKSYSFANPLVETVRAFLAASDAKWTEDYLHGRWAEWATL